MARESDRSVRRHARLREGRLGIDAAHRAGGLRRLRARGWRHVRDLRSPGHRGPARVHEGTARRLSCRRHRCRARGDGGEGSALHRADTPRGEWPQRVVTLLRTRRSRLFDQQSAVSTGYPIDLHTHSIASDGALTPTALIARAADRGVRALALADHDTLLGVAAAVA